MKEMKIRPTHPGHVFYEEVLKPTGVSIERAAEEMGVSVDEIQMLCDEQYNVGQRMAVRLGRYTGTTAESWLKMQENLDEWQARQ